MLTSTSSRVYSHLMNLNQKNQLTLHKPHQKQTRSHPMCGQVLAVSSSAAYSSLTSAPLPSTSLPYQAMINWFNSTTTLTLELPQETKLREFLLKFNFMLNKRKSKLFKSKKRKVMLRSNSLQLNQSMSHPHLITYHPDLELVQSAKREVQSTTTLSVNLLITNKNHYCLNNLNSLNHKTISIHWNKSKSY